MSDLDADLYGDLYGNDDPDFAEQNGAEPVAEVAAKPAPVPVPAAPPATTTQKLASTSASTQPIASYVPVTQQIPTYEQPQPSEYRGGSGDYQAGGERSVRPSEMKDEGKMFIGGLNWDTTDESLRNYFAQFGKVDACTIMRDAAGRSRCFAFLTFEDPANVNAVMVREHHLDGKIIDPKRAIPRSDHLKTTKLFIGGLAGSVTSESMREFFSQFGRVIDSTVMLDRETGRSKGFGFVSFEDTDVQPFLGFGKLEIDGKLIDVKLAQPRYQRDSYPSEDGEGGSGAGGNFGGGFGGQGNFNAGGAGNTPFDPQALAQLYTRMFQMSGANMNPALFSSLAPGMGGGMGMGMGMYSMGRGMGTPVGPAGAGAAAAMNPNIPRGPRNGPNGPTGPPGGAVGNAGVGPQRAGQRGQHNYHPYARG